MKKFTQFAVMAGLLFILSSEANAWDVYIKNTTNHVAKVEIDGEHLFWRQVDCVKTVQPHSEVICTMPGLICPISATATFSVPGGYAIAKSPPVLAMCFNTELRLYSNSRLDPDLKIGFFFR